MAKDADDNKQPPFETHHHTSAGFFTFNQLSNLVSFEAQDNGYDSELRIVEQTTLYDFLLLQDIVSPAISVVNLRAPPSFS
ncbi:MAG: hypothetical protein LBV43_13775 [Prevotella sp.]|jgi:hypothetical protein|nr:hypothetical protein [Prevotella sp.]